MARKACEEIGMLTSGQKIRENESLGQGVRFWPLRYGRNKHEAVDLLWIHKAHGSNNAINGSTGP
jgi:hypothetical protein